MAAEPEQEQTEFATSIITKQLSGITAFKPLEKNFETLMQLYEQAGAPNHWQSMDGDWKFELILAILVDPTTSPEKGLDGWILAQEESAGQEVK